MRTLRKVDRSGIVPRIVAYKVPDVGDKVIDKDGNESYCTGMSTKYEPVYEISKSWKYLDSEKVIVKESTFEQGILKVKTNDNSKRYSRKTSQRSRAQSKKCLD